MIFKLWRELTRLTARDYLPKVPRHFKIDYDPGQIRPDEQLIMNGAKARDLHTARRLLANNNNDIRLIDLTHEKPKANKRQRFINWLMRLEGSTPSDVTINSYLNRVGRDGVQSGVYVVPYED